MNGTSLNPIIESPTGHKTPSILPSPAMNLRRRQLRAPTGLPPCCVSVRWRSPFIFESKPTDAAASPAATSDPVTQERLFKLAAEYEAQADAQDEADEEAPAVRYGKRDDDDD